jgi:hypothetical protein
MSGSRPRKPDADSGQISILILGFVVLILALVAVISAVSALHLQRKRVMEASAAAAADAADALDLRTYYEANGPLVAVPLTDQGVRDSVEDYLDFTGGVPGCTHVEPASTTGTPDGTTASVTLACHWRSPVLSTVVPLLDTTVVVPGTGRARASLGAPAP